jgi:hypothetical protein
VDYEGAGFVSVRPGKRRVVLAERRKIEYLER